MNIHEHQAKEILKEFGAPVSNGIVIYLLMKLRKNKTIKKQRICLKAQIHAGEEEKQEVLNLVKILIN